MSTITAEQQRAISARLQGMTLPSGLGSEESACSIAAINLALTGELTDDIPACMSEVIGKWIIEVQDSMPSGIRNSQRWKSLLPLAAGTGRDMERERLDIVMDWMWGRVLPAMQPVADRGGFGKEWLAMTTHRTEAAARAAYEASAWDAADVASWAAAAKASALASVVSAMAAAAWAATAAADAAWVVTDAWTIFDPCGLLERLIRVGEQK